MDCEAAAHVAELCNTIRAAYLAAFAAYEEERTGRSQEANLRRYIPHWDGGTTRSGRNVGAVWPQIATFCVQHKLCGVTLVSAMFRTALGRAPTPHELHTSQALVKYAEYAKHHAENTRLAWASHFARFRTLTYVEAADGDLNAAARRVLCFGYEQFPPLFRYVVAMAGGAREVAARYFRQALSQYVGQRELFDDICVGTLAVPAELKDAADKLQSALR